MENCTELKRTYRCPKCDAVILGKVYYNTIHTCFDGIMVHNKHFNIEYEAI